ncbi:hypothetical protein AB0873_26685 [Micromonospora sp. NPDC047707]|uniref:hypothetical protein n=1 Tax=Micromonospora sp. NPDC047707 TaxID=3154498 RepID=UPI003453F9E7
MAVRDSRDVALAAASLLTALTMAAAGCAERKGASEPAPAPADAETGRDYAVTLSTHCGIDVTEFRGRRWKAEHPVDDPGARPDPNDPTVMRYDGQISGTMRLLTTETLRFTSDTGDLVVTFRPTTEAPAICQ